jgi:hypothetical protein
MVNGTDPNQNEQTAWLPSQSDEYQWKSKKRVDPKDMYQQQDYVKGGPSHPYKGDVSDYDISMGTGALNHTKFSKGFARRNHSNIFPEQDRLQYEEEKFKKRAVAREMRGVQLANNSCRYGNVINSDNAPPEIPRSKRVLEGPDQFELNRRRQNQGQSRFHREVTEKDFRFQQARAEASIKRQVQHSSVLGEGRRDLPSIGVWDNFAMNPAHGKPENFSANPIVNTLLVQKPSTADTVPVSRVPDSHAKQPNRPPRRTNASLFGIQTEPPVNAKNFAVIKTEKAYGHNVHKNFVGQQTPQQAYESQNTMTPQEQYAQTRAAQYQQQAPF